MNETRRNRILSKKRQLRHSSPYNVRVTPEFRKEPDMEKVVRALISTTEKMILHKKEAA